jgi:hypothetical protein
MPNERTNNTSMASRLNAELVTADLTSEFAAVRLTVERHRLGARLSVVNLETGEQIYLDALQLASMCHASEAQQRSWLRTGEYAEGPDGTVNVGPAGTVNVSPDGTANVGPDGTVTEGAV